MSSEKLYSEILDEFEQATTKNDRIAVLRKHWHARFQEFLEYAFNPAIEFDVGIPKYRPAVEPAGLNHTYLDLEVSKLYRFIKGHPKRPENLTPAKQKKLLTTVLESLHKDESALLVKLFNKDLEVKFLTIKLIQEAISGK